MAIQARSATRSPALKFFAVGILTFLMVVPLFMIYAVLYERTGRASEAAADIAQGWGGPQRVSGPFLAVPFTMVEQREENGRITNVTVRRTALFLPKSLDVAAQADVSQRQRGIFPVNVYDSELALTGSFTAPSFYALAVTPLQIDWRNAALFMLISDVRGIAENSAVDFGEGRVMSFAPGLGVEVSGYSGIHASVPFSESGQALSFSIKVKLKGSQSLSFSPVGEDTNVTVKSNWPHPSFQGAFLPDARTISAQGFDASYRIPYLRRSIDQQTINPENALYAADSAQFGVRFYEPVDLYQLVERALKYAILFVGLSFLVFFLTEILSGGQVHVVQYLLAGSAQVLFYLLLLSLSEHAGFDRAYQAAAGATVLLTALYAWSALRSFVLGLLVLVLIGSLYGLLYLLLKEEDYALLIGSVAAFAVLAVTMFVTRNIDWYQVVRAQALPDNE
ncbi:MAG: cell envelope integrity protein CreD [Alphaproteobacteria bacterium]|nr:cell envelope integrity protein CreD [Alphaproteobacteria bacterium]